MNFMLGQVFPTPQGWATSSSWRSSSTPRMTLPTAAQAPLWWRWIPLAWTPSGCGRPRGGGLVRRCWCVWVRDVMCCLCWIAVLYGVMLWGLFWGLVCFHWLCFFLLNRRASYCSCYIHHHSGWVFQKSNACVDALLIHILKINSSQDHNIVEV